MSGAEPLVSIVTPVYNGEKYLRECMDSVLAQTYSNWEYVIVDNRSTDKTHEIAAGYARRDPRIRVVRNAEFLPLIRNWNHALRQMDPAAKYCKVVHADDRLYPDCIRRMVNLAEKHPSIGIVSAYRMDEDTIGLTALGTRAGCIPGREVCRWRLTGGRDVFGSPTSVLLRADLVRRRRDFYNEQFLHADIEVCFDLLRNTDFGMVPEVLTYTRRHNESVTSMVKRFRTNKAEGLLILHKYGPHYLTPEEWERMRKRRLKHYYRFLAKRVFQRDAWKQRQQLREFLSYHRSALARLGAGTGTARFLMYIACALAGAFPERASAVR